MASPLIGISGAGIGGLAAAIALRKLGVESVVFEQAPRFARVGADINLTPNAVLALDGLGVGDELRKTAARPTHRISRTWDTGEETSRLEMSQAAETRYGAPQLTMHRADLLSALEQAVPADTIHLGKRTTGIEEGADGITVRFEDGSSRRVDVLVGADGIHSTVRKYLLGDEYPEFTGVVAYRAVVPASRLEGVPNLGAFTKWWGPNPETQIVTFPLNLGRDIFIFATTPQDSWRHESWTMPGSVEELRASYAGFHPEARALLDACDEVLKSALYVRDPLPSWSRGNITLLGDACHPMMPFMAQGAGMAIEDGIVLARHLAASPQAPAEALRRYEAARRERTARIQIGSRGNNWLKEGGNADWVYEYNAWSVPLV
ncbi:salicylate hydroxylase [Pigmentiphaga sp. NML080357]|uniref:FAD-dependent monooxygenase n=1 Tax=Pigmentiphaga sp. NML080357 TaxID=2008675 RepID=UPI000B407942|nr:FAD-dependent monooxygenase [Pigmentiphaga sp. NML080357]OVZ60667.1 salicylate hydroxylase [Pigmentiphaga sp. NML080357]